MFVLYKKTLLNDNDSRLATTVLLKNTVIICKKGKIIKIYKGLSRSKNLQNNDKYYYLCCVGYLFN